MARTKRSLIKKEDLKLYLELGYSYSQIGTELDMDRELVYYYAKKWELRDINVHKQHKAFCNRRVKPIPRLNTELADQATAFMDITEVTFRRQKSKHTRTLKGEAFLTFSKNDLTYLVYIRDHSKGSYLRALTKLAPYISDTEIILVDTELNPKIANLDNITFCNTTEWHPKENLVEKKHGFKLCVYASFRVLKSSSFDKLTDNDKALLLKLYLRFFELNDNFILLNRTELEQRTAQLKEIVINV